MNHTGGMIEIDRNPTGMCFILRIYIYRVSYYNVWKRKYDTVSLQ